MFWNLFKRKVSKQETQETNSEYKTWICYAMDEQGLIIDINIENFSEQSLDNFAKLLSGISTMAFVTDTVAVVKEGFESQPDDKFTYLMDRAIYYAQKEIKRITEEADFINEHLPDEPVVKPSDVIK